MMALFIGGIIIGIDWCCVWSPLSSRIDKLGASSDSKMDILQASLDQLIVAVARIEGRLDGRDDVKKEIGTDGSGVQK